MPRIFISYRRKSWPFTHRLAEELRQRLDAEIFVDLTSVDETDFEHAILRNLRESDAVLLIISEHTFAERIHRDDDWVRREIREALVLNKPLILVCVDGLLSPSGLPDDIKDVARMQGINFYPEYFIPAVDRLVEFMVKVGATRLRPHYAAAPTPTEGEKVISGSVTMEEALDVLDAGDHHKAIFLLESLVQAGYKSRFVDINVVLQRVRRDVEQADRRRQAARDYEEIAILARRKVTVERARIAFEVWCKDFQAVVEEMDTENLREQFKPHILRVRNILPPPFEWIEITAGKVTLIPSWVGGRGSYLKQETAFYVPTFLIAKYPVTNAQYAKFIEAGGYRKKKWWTAAGWEAREQGWGWNEDIWENTGKAWTSPRYWKNKKWNGANYPVIGISWYEAVAFCRWLSEASGEPVMLPTEYQWQRAAQGDDKRKYPWGNSFDPAKCNTKESGIDQTTPVTQYPDGASPYGVMDMIGNVCEWCLTSKTDGTALDGSALDGTAQRMVRACSWFDEQNSARIMSRSWYDPNRWDDDCGFRMVCASPI